MTREEIERELAEPFDPSEIKWKPAVVSGNRAMALAYVDARVIQDRLDEVLGVTGWQDDYSVMDNGSVTCKLSLKIGEEWITKMDVGSQSEQSDEGDRMKAAFSDALKRAAVKFGLGRFLYRLPMQWVDYDPQKRQFARQPQLPAYLQKKEAPADPPPAQAPARPREQPRPAGRDKDAVLAELKAAAAQGIEALGGAWRKLTPAEQSSCKKEKENLKKEASRAAIAS